LDEGILNKYLYTVIDYIINDTVIFIDLLVNTSMVILYFTVFVIMIYV